MIMISKVYMIQYKTHEVVSIVAWSSHDVNIYSFNVLKNTENTFKYIINKTSLDSKGIFQQ